MKKSFFVLLAVLGIAAVEAKGQVTVGVVKGCPETNIGGVTITSTHISIWCFYCLQNTNGYPF